MNPLIQFKPTTLSCLIVSVLMCFGLSPVAHAVMPPPDGGYSNGNTAEGDIALQNLTTGTFNTALGIGALFFNTTSSGNTATGAGALAVTAGAGNTANGAGALINHTTGNSNIALGVFAGVNLKTGDANIYIGNAGVADESDTIRIGTQGTQGAAFIAGVFDVDQAGPTQVVTINANGQLGTTGEMEMGSQGTPSSRRFKKEIKPMEKVSEAILALKPVTFQYKSDKKATPQFGLIAEEVAQVNPDLIVRDEKGEIYSVRYDAVNAMLLNEFLKQHRKNEKQEATIAELKKDIAGLTATVKEQAAQIQKVSAQIEMQKPSAQTVANNQ